MNQKEQKELRGYSLIVIWIFIVYFFQVERQEAWDWNRFFVGIYEQAMGFIFPYYFVNVLHIKSEWIKNLVFITLFLIMDNVVTVHLELPVGAISYILLAISTALWIVSILFLRKVFNNKENALYTRRNRRRDLIIHTSALVVNMVLVIFLYKIRFFDGR